MRKKLQDKPVIISTDTELIERVHGRIQDCVLKCSPGQFIILDSLVTNWGLKPVFMPEIAGNIEYIEASKLQHYNLENRMRRVRYDIRKLRIEHQIPILTTGKGYYLITEYREGLKSLQHIKTSIESSLEIYEGLKRSIGLTDESLEVLQSLLGVKPKKKHK